MTYWRGKRVLVTGGSGFIGSHAVEALLDEGACVRVTGRDSRSFRKALGKKAAGAEFMEGDLLSSSFCQQACDGMEIVLHLAAQVAGVQYNESHPGTIFTRNVALGLNVLDAAANRKVSRFLCMSSACVYRRHCAIPTPETEGFLEDPEPTNLGYGWAKRVLEVQARCYADEFGIQVAIVRPYNAYGPRDNFDPETSHVIPSLIRKVMSGQDPVVVWGDGSQTRSFLYVSDFIEGSLAVLERYPCCDPVNLGTAEEITVGELVQMILQISGKKAKVVFDASRPSGQPRRKGNLSKLLEKTGFSPKVNIREGLEKTIQWYAQTLAGSSVQ